MASFSFFLFIDRRTKTLLAFTLSFVLCLPLLQGQLVKMADLPQSIKESSGIIMGNGHTIWTFNDSGGKQELYQCDTIGRLVRTLKIKKGPNDDWEDITRNEKGDVYIGNFGNNSNKRKELSLFKIPNPSLIKEESVIAEKIGFQFEDQTAFPPPKDQMNFDCEAVLWYNDHLYLFTKHRTLPMTTNLYRIPDTSGHHIAQKLGSFATGVASEDEHPWFGYWITAADISPDKRRVALISGTQLWVFYDFEGDHFFAGKVRNIKLGPNTQKEAVCFVNNSEIYITDELWKPLGVGGNLYKLDLEPYFD